MGGDTGGGRRAALYLILLVMSILLLLTGLAPHAIWAHWSRLDLPLHSSVEAVGAVAALMMGSLLVLRRGKGAGRAHALAAGFIGMGVLDGVHSIAVPGNGFVLLHSTAMLAGGLGFILVWLPRRAFTGTALWTRWLPGGVAALATASGAVVIWHPEWFPAMLAAGGFTPSAVALNAAAGLLFLAAAGRLLIEFHRTGRTENYLFACMALLSGLAGVLFAYSAPWDDSWWLWHIYRLAAYMLVFLAINMEHRVMLTSLRVSLDKRRRAGEEWRHTFDSITDFVSVHDRNFRFVKVNRALAGFLGMKPEEVVGKRCCELMHCRKEPLPNCPHARMLVTNRTETEEIFDPHIGRPLMITTSPIVNAKGEVVASVHIARDITERKKMEEEIRTLNADLQKRLTGIMESVPVGIALSMPEGRVSDANPAIMRILGYESKEEFLRAPAVVNYHDPADRARFIELIRKGPVRGLELRLRRKDGSLFWGSVNSVLNATRSGTMQIITALEDITERKRAEEEMQGLNAELTRRAAELEAANRELEAFSYSVSHDLRAPLRAIDGFSRVLVEDHAGGLDAGGQRVLGVIRSNTQRMGQLIDDLLTFSRLGRARMEPSALDMAALARSVFEDIRAANPGRAFRFDIAEPVPCAPGDRSMVRQVLVNLLSNAVKFTRPRAEADIGFGGRADGPQAEYYVKDNGVGFDMQYAGKLFGVFQRLHSMEEFEGTGVGLAIVQRIVHRHGGRVGAEGKVGEGATFRFTLPLKEA